MNILFLLRLWPVYGGGETVTICLANEMAHRGWQVGVAYFKETRQETDAIRLTKRIRTLHIEGVNCDEFTADPHDKDKVQNAVLKYINENGVDVVINQWWMPYYISRLKAETTAKVISCLHQAFFTLILNDGGFKGYSKRLLRPLYEKWKKRKMVNDVESYFPYVDRYVFLSPAFQRQFEAFSDYKGDKLDAIPNPLVYDATISEDKFQKKENIVLIV